jgi:signal transduction histidine kinase
VSTEPYRILIVDDSDEDRATYRRRIARDAPNSYAFFEAATGEQGLALCRRESPSCVLLDYNLPDIDGLEFLARLRDKNGTVMTPVVVLTGHGSEVIAAAAIKAGAQDYVVKRLGGGDVRRVVHAAMDRAALNLQLEEGRQAVHRLAKERSVLVEQLQQQAHDLRESARRKDEFMAVLAHELRNPLSPLRNATKILNLPGTSDAEQARARRIIERQVAHMSRMVDDLLDVSRISLGTVAIQRQPLDLAGVTRVSADDHRAGIEAAGQTLTIDIPDAPVWVDGDATRLAQVIDNVLHNASKFTDRGGHIDLSLSCADGSAVVTVSDSGIGMDAHQLAHAFEPFNQADKSLDRSRGGLGLGLALSRGLIEAHGGRVQAESHGIGTGCRLSFTIPLDHAPQAASTPPADGAVACSRRVLVIEDNVDSATSLGTLLESYGHTPLIAHAGVQGLHAARTFRPEVVLCDIGLPGGMDGYAVARAIRGDKELEATYLVAVTGYSRDRDREHARAAGFDLHLTKPIDLDKLERLLATAPLRAR